MSGRQAYIPGTGTPYSTGKAGPLPPSGLQQQVRLLDVDAFQKQILDQTTKDFQPPQVKSSIIVLGKDKRTDARNQLMFPSFMFIELLKDGIDNIFTELKWRINRLSVEGGNVIGFNVYRKRYTTEEVQNDPDFGFLVFNAFNARSFARLSDKITKKGKFGEEKKAISFIKRGDIDPLILNNNLINDLSRNSAPNSTISALGEIESILTSAKFEKIAYVDYSNFTLQQQRKFVLVKTRDVVDLTYIDKKVGYNEVFEYYITCVTKDSQESAPSNSIKVFIQDPSPVFPPLDVTVKQLNPTSINLQIVIDSKANIGKALIFRRSDDEHQFTLLDEVDNVSDSITMVDDTVSFYKTYTYRVFLQNIFGFFSEPKEVKLFSNVQKITPQSRFNNLKIPVFSVTQDQNFRAARIVISPNDTSVSYYEIKRRDLTTKERKFSVPSKLETNYGGNGWQTNKFFITKRNVVKQNSDVVLTTSMYEIVFLDDAVALDHIYQYQIRGYDLKGNATSYQLADVKIQNVLTSRTPINLFFTVLRNNPFRVKISWTDDNISTSGKKLYKVQRRKKTSTIYESFPLTENNFLIDEVATDDFIEFITRKINDNFTNLENKPNPTSVIKRPFGLPEFLQPNEVYYYRFASISEESEVENETQEQSSFSEEFEVSTLATISEPFNFSAVVFPEKITPLSVKLKWSLDESSLRPDHWIIERKTNERNDVFTIAARVYFQTECFDRNLKVDTDYIYRITSVDIFGNRTTSVETRLKT
jgi:hypothetical protein